MIKLGQLFVLFTFMISIQAQASSVSAAAVVEDYFALEMILKQNPRDPSCRPNTSCLKVACSTLDRFECDDASEVEEINRACRGNFGGECILVAKKYLDRFELDDRAEMIQLLGSCRGLFDLDCVEYSCQRVGRFGCDDLEEVMKINMMCAGR